MDTIILKSDNLKVVKINKRTKAKMFKNLKVGDIVAFSIPIERVGRNGGTYAAYITATNLETREETRSSFNQIPTILKAFEFEKA